METADTIVFCYNYVPSSGFVLFFLVTLVASAHHDPNKPASSYHKSQRLIQLTTQPTIRGNGINGITDQIQGWIGQEWSKVY